MAEGRSTRHRSAPVVTEGTVEKHVRSFVQFADFGTDTITPVQAVVRSLESR